MDDKTNLTTFLNLMETAIKNSKPINFQLFESLPAPDNVLNISDNYFEIIIDDKIIPEPLKTKIESIDQYGPKYIFLTKVIIKYFFDKIKNKNYLQKNDGLQTKIKLFI